MDKTVRLQPEASGGVIARFRQHGVTVDYAPLTARDVDMLGETHDLTGPIEISAILMLADLDEKKKASAPESGRSPLHAMLHIFTGTTRGRR